MRYLLIAPQLGFKLSGELVPGGLLQFGRCVARALASSPCIGKLDIWSQVDQPNTKAMVERMVRVYAHPELHLDVRMFGGSRTRLALALAEACRRQAYDQVMYLLVNQAVLTALPGHLPYAVWEIGRELSRPLSWWKYRALHQADALLSISQHTTQAATQNNPGLPLGKVVHLCVEPPLFTPEPREDPPSEVSYQPAGRERAVLIVANMHRGHLYKGHQQLIAAWPAVVEVCGDAELWIVGGGDGQSELEAQVRTLPPAVARRILFLGQIDNAALQGRYRRCRVFAMPSTGEGFGLVFVEAARYGVPGIGGKHDSVKEIVLHHQTGLLVEQDRHDIASACQQLLTDDDLAQRLGEAARRRYLSHFQFQHFQQRLLQTLALEV